MFVTGELIRHTRVFRPSPACISLPYRCCLNCFANYTETSKFMKACTFHALLVALVATGPLRADDPFVGKWKINSSRTTLFDQMKVGNAGANKLVLDFGGGPETVIPDGTDQPGNSGTTLSVTIERADTWKVVRKKAGRALLTASWKLSPDGNTLSDDYTEFDDKGTADSAKYVYRRTAGGSGFAGTWESSSATMNSGYIVEIRPWDGDGLSIIDHPEVVKNVKFDGKEYPNQGEKASKDSTSSVRRVGQGTLELTDKINGRIVGTRQFVLSADLKSLTITVPSGVPGKPNLLVFDREAARKNRR
jgi:hypothetical protein